MRPGCPLDDLIGRHPQPHEQAALEVVPLVSPGAAVTFPDAQIFQSDIPVLVFGERDFGYICPIAQDCPWASGGRRHMFPFDCALLA